MSRAGPTPLEREITLVKPDITVAICTHSNAAMLERVLARLAEQRVAAETRWELVVVDNCSADRTPEVLAAVGASGVFPAFRAVQEPRLGLSNARRTALAAAHADLIAFVDDDCLLGPDWVENAVRFARATPRAGAFGGKVELEWVAPPTPLALACAWALAQQDHGPAAVRVHEKGGGSLVGAGVVLRRVALDDSGWIEAGQMTGRVGKVLAAGDDAEISLRIRAAGWELWYDPALRLKHLMPPGRMDPAYLARLHRGTGKTAPYIAVLSGVHRRGPLSRLYFCYRGLVKAASKALRAAFYLALGRRLAAQTKWMQAHYWYGCFEGGLSLPGARPAPQGGDSVTRSHA
jgi:glycosyltransferase involved in cell wall biosynthesis